MAKKPYGTYELQDEDKFVLKYLNKDNVFTYVTFTFKDGKAIVQLENVNKEDYILLNSPDLKYKK